MSGLFWWRRSVEAESLATGGIHDNGADVRAAHDAVGLVTPMLVSQLREIYLRAQRLLEKPAMDTCCQSIGDDLVAAHRLLSARAPEVVEGKPPKAVVSLLTTRIRLAERYVAKQSDARALRSYNRGLGMATIYSIGVLLVIACIGWGLLQLLYRGDQAPAISLALYQTLVAIGGGAVGAMVSVLLRTVTGIADVDDASLAHAAVRRVVLGWIFAAVVVFLLKGGIITAIKSPGGVGDSGITEWFFWGGIGFLAGFNERWVRQLISRTPGADETAKPTPEPEPAPEREGVKHDTAARTRAKKVITNGQPASAPTVEVLSQPGKPDPKHG
jgi:hypothetical protein